MGFHFQKYKILRNHEHKNNKKKIRILEKLFLNNPNNIK